MTQSSRSYRMQGRAAATGRTRERILAVARDRFVEQPYDEVTLTEIAATAGVTQQTVLNHFGSKEGLLLALVDVLGAEVQALRGPPPVGDPAALVRGLMRQYEALGDANVRLAAVAERIPLLAAGLETARRTHRGWLEECFAEQLPTHPRHRRQAVAALYAATDVGTWKLLRRDLGHSRADTAAVMNTLVRAALTVPAS